MNHELLLTLLIFVVILTFANATVADIVPRITKEELNAMLSSPELIIIDVRQLRDWESDDSKIRGAIREDPNNFKELPQKYSPQKTLVFYCA